MADRSDTRFRRDRLTWLAYLMLAWFAYLQAAPGLVIVHLRDELDLSYSTGGLHVAAFAAGSLVAGIISARLERAIGRRTLFWSSAALMGAGTAGLTVGRVAAPISAADDQNSVRRPIARSRRAEMIPATRLPAANAATCRPPVE